MRTRTKIDKADRLVFLKAIHQALDISLGYTIETESDDNRAVLSPVRVRPACTRSGAYRCIAPERQ